ncbi:MBL fold metallo-hydrolase [Snodgrassella sp. CFCC 13594]|uniref:MBL fold metallo-hydrolase n=1 Tax=Snodgrassella sp. CFCC 13594 TaxID=1775559 RepID=UPI00082A9E0F|nr:MBL fold metallo-hydrolase [Snodgrassella sp. CFCC 13594]
MATDITLTVLGCGSSSGSPVIGCGCNTCMSLKPQNTRSRCSAHLTIGTQHWQIDTGTDFRSQALTHHLNHIDGVLYTHPHADHLNGIDDLRAFCYQQQTAIPIYGNHFTMANIEDRFGYAFLPISQHWNRPVLQSHVWPLNQGQSPVFDIDGVPVWHFGVPHGHWTTSAFRIGNVAWFTDLNHIDDAMIERLQGLDYLFLDCLMDKAYPSHLSTDQAFEYAERIGAQHTYFIHMTHMLEYEALNARCPPKCAVAYDGLSINSSYP